MNASTTITASPRPSINSAPADLRAEAFARFDLAYQTTWPAEMGQFWADRYPPGAAPYANLVHARNRRVCALLRGGESVLDIGSGYGDLLYLLRDRYRTLRGVDPSAKSCAMATYNLASRGVPNDFVFERSLAESLPYPGESFDAAICLDTYEHIEPANRPAALAEAKRVLTPGGQLVLVTPSRRTLAALAVIDNLITFRRQWKVRKHTGWRPHIFGLPKKEYCEQFCTKRELLAEMRAAGFTIERFERCSFYPAPERGGFFYPFFEKLPAGHARLARIMRVVEALERLGWFNQKMLVLARNPGRPSNALRPPEHFALPAGYRQRTAALTHDEASTPDGIREVAEYWNPERIAASARYQHHVYAWGAALVRERGLHNVLDLGCGPATKLASLIAPVCADVEGFDQPSAIAAAKRLIRPGRYTVVDLERCGAFQPKRTFDLVICADVIEHLLDPDPAFELIRRCCHPQSLVLLSTPDRARLRGRSCMSSDKPEHVREWSTPEFLALLRSRGFQIIRHRLLPGDDAPVGKGRLREMLWRAHLAPTSPHRCLTVLCRPIPT